MPSRGWCAPAKCRRAKCRGEDGGRERLPPILRGRKTLAAALPRSFEDLHSNEVVVVVEVEVEIGAPVGTDEVVQANRSVDDARLPSPWVIGKLQIRYLRIFFGYFQVDSLLGHGHLSFSALLRLAVIGSVRGWFCDSSSAGEIIASSASMTSFMSSYACWASEQNVSSRRDRSRRSANRTSASVSSIKVVAFCDGVVREESARPAPSTTPFESSIRG